MPTPQLDKDLEKRFDERFSIPPDFIEPTAGFGYKPERRWTISEPDKIKQFLATELEAQKQQAITTTLERIEGIIGEDEWEDPDIRGKGQNNGDMVTKPWRRNGLRAGCPYCGNDLCDCESGKKTALRIFTELSKLDKEK